MFIDKFETYAEGDYTYRNFVTLSKDELLLILRERNHPDVKKWMFNNEDIQEGDHLAFVEGLKNRNDAYYWLMEYKGVPIGVLSLIHINYEMEEGETGYYLFASHQDSGLGLDMQFHYKKLFFSHLGVRNLPGEILWGNTNAYQMSLFFGAEVDGTMEREGRKYVVMHTSKENFEKIEGRKLTSKFIKYIKSHPVSWE